MHSYLPTRLLYAMLLLSLGFATGWWMKGWGPGAGGNTGYNAAGYNSGPDRNTAPAVASGPSIDVPQWKADAAQADIARNPTGTPLMNTPVEKTSDADETPPHFMDEFRALLAAEAFGRAMNLYVDTERRSSSDALQLKDAVMAHLQNSLRTSDNTAFTNLADAFLARYYDDVDILLILARYHLQSGYPAEAANSYQLAFTYAFAQSEQRRVTQAFRKFVREVDDLLVHQARWQELISFYETLESLGLARPEYQLRQAELYIAQGEINYGRSLLTHLIQNPAVATEAAAMLDGLQTGGGTATIERRATDQRGDNAADSIALDSVGSHYHLPLRVNDLVDVHLIIDTGATTTTVSKRTFEAISGQTRFVELGPQLFNTASGVAKGTMYRVANIQLGNQRLSDVNIAVLDFDTPPGVDGLLGMNVLRGFRFQVDQDERRLYLHPR